MSHVVTLLVNISLGTNLPYVGVEGRLYVKGIVHLFNMLKQLFTLIKMVQFSPLPDEKMRRNEEKHEEEKRPTDSILGRP